MSNGPPTKPPFPRWDDKIDTSVPANIPESGSWGWGSFNPNNSPPLYGSGNLPSIFRTGWAEKVGGKWPIVLAIIVGIFDGVGVMTGKIPGEFGLWIMVTGLYPIASGYTTYVNSHKTRLQSQYRTEVMMNAIGEARKHITHEVKKEVQKAIELQPPTKEEGKETTP